jgi:hypothetical protein
VLLPRALIDRLARGRVLWPGVSIVLGAAALWALLCLLLAAGGHAPSVALVPIAREHYYLWQAGFVAPLLLAQWGLCSLVVARLARAQGGTAADAATANAMAIALALPLVALFLVPDLIAYGAGGFAALGPLVRITAPLSFLVTLALATDAVRALHGLPVGKALLASAAGVLVQAALGGVLLR